MPEYTAVLLLLLLRLPLLQVCWDFYHAAKAGYEALGQAATEVYCQGKPNVIPSEVVKRLFELPGPASLGGWVFWDSVVQQPMQLKLPQLKDAARNLALQVKHEVVAGWLLVVKHFSFVW
jgi:hypothetical protein